MTTGTHTHTTPATVTWSGGDVAAVSAVSRHVWDNEVGAPQDKEAHIQSSRRGMSSFFVSNIETSQALDWVAASSLAKTKNAARIRHRKYFIPFFRHCSDLTSPEHFVHTPTQAAGSCIAA